MLVYQESVKVFFLVKLYVGVWRQIAVSWVICKLTYVIRAVSEDRL
jgi:hypothetical protein